MIRKKERIKEEREGLIRRKKEGKKEGRERLIRRKERRKEGRERLVRRNTDCIDYNLLKILVSRKRRTPCYSFEFLTEY